MDRPGDCSTSAGLAFAPGGGVVTPPLMLWLCVDAGERGVRNGDAARSCLKLPGRLAMCKLSLFPGSPTAEVGAC